MNEFMRKVAKLRELQKQFFKGHDMNVLQQCKELEREVDKDIYEATRALQTAQKTLF